MKIKVNTESDLFCVTSYKKACSDNLQKRGSQLCDRCHLCGKNSETINQFIFVLSHCFTTLALFMNMLGLQWTMPEDIIDLTRS